MLCRYKNRLQSASASTEDDVKRHQTCLKSHKLRSLKTKFDISGCARGLIYFNCSVFLLYVVDPLFVLHIFPGDNGHMSNVYMPYFNRR